MSLYNCDVHGRRVPGSLETAYVALLRGGVRYSRKLRLCPDHLTEILGSEQWGLAQVSDDESVDPQTLCSACQQATLAGSSFDAAFVTAFRRGEERSDYFAGFCRDCSERFISALALGL